MSSKVLIDTDNVRASYRIPLPPAAEHKREHDERADDERDDHNHVEKGDD
jgi:hypothetical protein